MDESLQIPTATSAREIPAKLLIENRKVINTHLAATTGGKVSFTHLIGYAIIEALVEMPSMNVRFEKDEDGHARRFWTSDRSSQGRWFPLANGSSSPQGRYSKLSAIH